jgi:DNA-directed RNA polymerase subunit RPC12/RpoP
MNNPTFPRRRIHFFNNNNYKRHSDSRNLNKNPQNKYSNKQNGTILKYSCLFCSRDYKRTITNRSFNSGCRSCFKISPLEKFSYVKNVLYGNYTCTRRECGYRWSTKVSFTDIILCTPICKPCGRLTKVTQIDYRNKQVLFNNISTYVCYQCKTSKKITNNGLKDQQDRIAECNNCKERLFYKGCFKKIVIVENAGNYPKERKERVSDDTQTVVVPQEEKEDLKSEKEVIHV